MKLEKIAQNITLLQNLKDSKFLASQYHDTSLLSSTFSHHIYHFPSNTSDATKTPPIVQVGGKGFSLIHMANAGIAVPPGFVLSTLFFEDWIKELYNSTVWASFKTALASVSQDDVGIEEDSAIKINSDKVKRFAKQNLKFSDGMKALLDSAWKMHNFEKVAVRSSSPEEDLGGASFAGGYETILGVKKESLQDAILDAFVSCLDARVVMYKIAHSFSALTPSIAVVVQQQVNCDVAGVAFSVNPITNCNTEVFVNSNFGLGESVVAGIVSPDEWVVEKKTGKVIKRNLGAKGMYVKLKEEGGIEHIDAESSMSARFSMEDEMVSKVSSQVEIIEKLYHTAIDIEFGIAKNELYILQARPVTTSLPFPLSFDDEWTKDAHVLWDVSLGVQGLSNPISVLGNDLIGVLPHILFHKMAGSLVPMPSPKVASPVIILSEIGRLYVNVSMAHNVFTKDVVSNIPLMDPIAADILQELDLELPNHPTLNKFSLIFRILFHAPLLKMVSSVIRTLWDPTESHRVAHFELDRAIERIKLIKRKPGELLVWVVKVFDALGFLLTTVLLPRMFSWRYLHGKMDDLLNKHHLLDDAEGKSHYQKLEKSLPGNVTVEMGMELSKIAKIVVDENFDQVSNLSVEELEDAFNGKSKLLPDDIRNRWRDFILKYGHRGDVELDFSTPRYRENARTLLLQITQQIQNPNANDAVLQNRKSQREREQAFEYFHTQILLKGNKNDAKRFERLYTGVTGLGGFRETPKFTIIRVIDLIRREVLAIGENLVNLKLLENRDQVFDFVFSDLDKIIQKVELVDKLDDVSETSRLISSLDENLDIKKIRDMRLQLWSRWDSYAKSGKELPRIIDTRGKIYRPIPKKLELDEETARKTLVGYPVSAGVFEGRIKLLSRPDEKPLLPGEILVARCTNPGWTPLFINAGAVMLEVGGVLQHGALVAREYGIPAVAGLVGMMEDPRLKDGVMVRVDGNVGYVTIMESI